MTGLWLKTSADRPCPVSLQQVVPPGAGAPGGGFPGGFPSGGFPGGQQQADGQQQANGASAGGAGGSGGIDKGGATRTASPRSGEHARPVTIAERYQQGRTNNTHTASAVLGPAPGGQRRRTLTPNR